MLVGHSMFSHRNSRLIVSLGSVTRSMTTSLLTWTFRRLSSLQSVVVLSRYWATRCCKAPCCLFCFIRTNGLFCAVNIAYDISRIHESRRYSVRVAAEVAVGFEVVIASLGRGHEVVTPPFTHDAALDGAIIVTPQYFRPCTWSPRCEPEPDKPPVNNGQSINMDMYSVCTRHCCTSKENCRGKKATVPCLIRYTTMS
jgi:hypothetical protein